MYPPAAFAYYSSFDKRTSALDFFFTNAACTGEPMRQGVSCPVVFCLVLIAFSLVALRESPEPVHAAESADDAVLRYSRMSVVEAYADLLSDDIDLSGMSPDRALKELNALFTHEPLSGESFVERLIEFDNRFKSSERSARFVWDSMDSPEDPQQILLYCRAFGGSFDRLAAHAMYECVKERLASHNEKIATQALRSGLSFLREHEPTEVDDMIVYLLFDHYTENKNYQGLEALIVHRRGNPYEAAIALNAQQLRLSELQRASVESTPEEVISKAIQFYELHPRSPLVHAVRFRHRVAIIAQLREIPNNDLSDEIANRTRETSDLLGEFPLRIDGRLTLWHRVHSEKRAYNLFLSSSDSPTPPKDVSDSVRHLNDVYAKVKIIDDLGEALGRYHKELIVSVNNNTDRLSDAIEKGATKVGVAVDGLRSEVKKQGNAISMSVERLNETTKELLETAKKSKQKLEDIDDKARKIQEGVLSVNKRLERISEKQEEIRQAIKKKKQRRRFSIDLSVDLPKDRNFASYRFLCCFNRTGEISVF
ncbi:MAG: hypothetical protein AAFQ16_12625, partial [Pseudomonadota bacterium]